MTTATPVLRDLVYTADIRPQIKLLVGKDGMQSMWEDIYQTCRKNRIKDMYAIGSQGPRSINPKYFPTWEKKIKTLGTTLHIAVPKPIEGYVPPRPYDIRFYPKEYKTGGTFTIYGNKVAIGTFDKDRPHATIIESKAIAAQFKQLWELVWSFSIEPTAVEQLDGANEE